MHAHLRLQVIRFSAALAAAVLVLASGLDAQQSGTVTGRATDTQSGQPLGAVQVYVNGLDLGVLTQQNGRYLLQDVPAGTHTVAAERIGYGTVTAEVVVGAGETVVRNFELTEEALQLDEVIVTGTPGGTQRRALGNSVGDVSASEITDNSQINTFQDLLTGQAAGLDFVRSSGNIGTGSAIQIRGVSSLALGQAPLIYVDGVRVNNRTDMGPDLTTRGGSGQSSALDDFSPDDIESIEIIRGPAAATLYGTEASAGVIQIITKRGTEGAPQIEASVSQGASFMKDPSGKLGTQWGLHDGELIEGFEGHPNIYEYNKHVNGIDLFQYGRSQSYNVSARGGTDVVRYFVSGGWQDDEGIVDYNWNERLSLRGNLGIVFSEALTMDVSVGYISGDTRYAQQLSEPGGIWEVIHWAKPEALDTDRRGFLRFTPEELEIPESTREYRRFTGSATLTHEFGGWLTQRLIVGMDNSNDENQFLMPRQPEGTASAFGGFGLGQVQLTRPLITETTLDYAASFDYSFIEALDLTTSVGAQFNSSELNQINSKGDILASSALRSIEGATRLDVGQDFTQSKSLGVYVQQEFNWNDRIFLTGAVRADDNSAFGSDFDAAIYPKVSSTWVISEEGFWDEVPYVSSLRLRTALGQAGRQPNTFDAVTLFEPRTGRAGEPGMVPGNLGNPEVGPEVGTELEVGFDYGLFGDRVSGEFTYFHQWTRDALASLPLQPSRGFSGSEAVNLGQLNNWGWEATANARLAEREGWALDVGLSADHVYNEIIDLGGRPPSFSLREGLPFPIEHTDYITSAEFDEFGNPINVMCDSGTGPLGLEPGGEPVPCAETAGYELLLGPAYPTYSFAVDASLFLMGRSLQLFALAEGEHGAWNGSTDVWCRFSGCFLNARAVLVRDDPIFVETDIFQQRHPSDDRLHADYDASFWKLRRLGARYQIPESWTQGIGADRASISVSGMDLFTLWRKSEEISGVPIPDSEFTRENTSSDLGQMPPLSSISVQLNVTF